MIDYSFPMLNGELTKFDFFNIKKPRKKMCDNYIITKFCCACAKDMPMVKKAEHCAQCRSVHYCSAECQKADWPNHKAFCRYVRDNIATKVVDLSFYKWLSSRTTMNKLAYLAANMTFSGENNSYYVVCVSVDITDNKYNIVDAKVANATVIKGFETYLEKQGAGCYTTVIEAKKNSKTVLHEVRYIPIIREAVKWDFEITDICV